MSGGSILALIAGLIMGVMIGMTVVYLMICHKDKRLDYRGNAKIIAKTTDEEHMFIAEYKKGNKVLNTLCLIDDPKVRVGDELEIVVCDICKMPLGYSRLEYNEKCKRLTENRFF